METHHESEHSHTEKTSLRTFIPLIIIFGVIILITGILQWKSGGDMMIAMKNFMGVFFLVFGLFKILNWKGFVSAYMMYDIVAKRSRVYAYLYPVIELVLGVLYLLSISLLLTNIVTFFLMTVSAIGVGNELRKKNQITCACLGAVFKIPMTKVTLLEDILMASMALVMISLLA